MRNLRGFLTIMQQSIEFDQNPQRNSRRRERSKKKALETIEQYVVLNRKITKNENFYTVCINIALWVWVDL